MRFPPSGNVGRGTHAIRTPLNARPAVNSVRGRALSHRLSNNSLRFIFRDQAHAAVRITVPKSLRGEARVTANVPTAEGGSSATKMLAEDSQNNRSDNGHASSENNIPHRSVSDSKTPHSLEDDTSPSAPLLQSSRRMSHIPVRQGRYSQLYFHGRSVRRGSDLGRPRHDEGGFVIQPNTVNLLNSTFSDLQQNAMQPECASRSRPNDLEQVSFSNPTASEVPCSADPGQIRFPKCSASDQFYGNFFGLNLSRRPSDSASVPHNDREPLRPLENLATSPPLHPFTSLSCRGSCASTVDCRPYKPYNKNFPLKEIDPVFSLVNVYHPPILKQNFMRLLPPNSSSESTAFSGRTPNRLPRPPPTDFSRPPRPQMSLLPVPQIGTPPRRHQIYSCPLSQSRAPSLHSRCRSPLPLNPLSCLVSNNNEDGFVSLRQLLNGDTAMLSAANLQLLPNRGARWLTSNFHNREEHVNEQCDSRLSIGFARSARPLVQQCSYFNPPSLDSSLVIEPVTTRGEASGSIGGHSGFDFLNEWRANRPQIPLFNETGGLSNPDNSSGFSAMEISAHSQTGAFLDGEEVHNVLPRRNALRGFVPVNDHDTIYFIPYEEPVGSTSPSDEPDQLLSTHEILASDFVSNGRASVPTIADTLSDGAAIEFNSSESEVSATANGDSDESGGETTDKNDGTELLPANSKNPAGVFCHFQCSRVADVLFIPCRHRVICTECVHLSLFSRCSICYEPIKGATDTKGDYVPISGANVEKLTQEDAQKMLKEAVEEAKKEVENEDRDELSALIDELERLEGGRMCIICNDKRSTVLFGCGHAVCGECDKPSELSECPACKATISLRQALFS